MSEGDMEAQITAASDMIGRAAASLPDFPGRQTPAEIAEMARAAGFGPVPGRVEVTYMAAWPASRRLRELDTWPEWPTILPVAERRAHRCDERCTCPVDGKPMLYWPAGGEHACQDPECRYAHGGEDD